MRKKKTERKKKCSIEPKKENTGYFLTFLVVGELDRGKEKRRRRRWVARVSGGKKQKTKAKRGFFFFLRGREKNLLFIFFSDDDDARREASPRGTWRRSSRSWGPKTRTRSRLVRASRTGLRLLEPTSRASPRGCGRGNPVAEVELDDDDDNDDDHHAGTDTDTDTDTDADTDTDTDADTDGESFF